MSNNISDNRLILRLKIENLIVETTIELEVESFKRQQENRI
jgi:hypothetical protein